MLRHIWRGVWQPCGGRETVFHSFLYKVVGQFIKAFVSSKGAAQISQKLEFSP